MLLEQINVKQEEEEMRNLLQTYQSQLKKQQNTLSSDKAKNDTGVLKQYILDIDQATDGKIYDNSTNQIAQTNISIMQGNKYNHNLKESNFPNSSERNTSFIIQKYGYKEEEISYQHRTLGNKILE